jgi:hypothetical protein
MPEIEDPEPKPRLSAELLHQLLGEHVEKAGQTLRRKEHLDTSAVSYILWLVTALLCVLGLSVYIIPVLDLMSVQDLASWAFLFIPLIFVVSSISRILISSGPSAMVKQDLALAAWQLRRIYELASRYEDTGPEIEPALRTGMVLKLGEAQLLLTQLAKFEAKDGRFAEMRSLAPDPLRLQSRGEAQSGVAPDLATTQH